MKISIKQIMSCIVGIFVVIAFPLTNHFLHEANPASQQALGATTVFTSKQVGLNPQSNYILSTNGTSSIWIVNSGGGGGSALHDWQKTADLSAISPTTTVGIVVNASSSILSLTVANSTTTNASSSKLFSTNAIFTNSILGFASTTALTISGASYLGTPSSLVLTNATGLPVSTGISGLGGGIATWLATPSSANLATAVTDETGIAGSAVFSVSPTFTGTAIFTNASSTYASTTSQTVQSKLWIASLSDGCLSVASSLVTSATCASGALHDWQKTADLSAISPTTTVGIVVNASSTIGGGTAGTGLNINGGATSTRLVVGPGAGSVTGSTLVQFNDVNGGNSDWSFNVASDGVPSINLQSTGGTLGTPTTSIVGTKSSINTYVYNSTPAQKQVTGILSALTDATTGSEDSTLIFKVITAGTFANELTLLGASLNPSTNNGLDLGDSTHYFSTAYITNASSTYASTTGSSGANSTFINATNTNLFATNASSTFTWGANLSPCSGATNAITWSAGKWGCNVITASGGSNWINTTAGSAITPSTTVNVSIGTSTPKSTSVLTVASNTPYMFISDLNAGTDQKHAMIGYNDGKFTIGTTSDSGTASSTSFTLTPGLPASLGIGTSTSAGGMEVTGTVFMHSLTTSAGTQSGVVCVASTKELINDSVACIASSKRFKQDINDLNNALDEVMSLKPVSFKYTAQYNGALQSNPNYSGEQVGFIAEDVQKIDPRLVVVETDGKDIGLPHSVRYENLTALLAGAIQAQQKQINRFNLQWIAIIVLLFAVGRQQIQINLMKNEKDS